MEKTKDQIFEEMIQISINEGVFLTENAYNIANYRAKANIPFFICPCKIRDKNRGCQLKNKKSMKKKCKNEILKNGICHCRCFMRIDNV